MSNPELRIYSDDISSTRIKGTPFSIKGSQVQIYPDSIRRYDYSNDIILYNIDGKSLKFVDASALAFKFKIWRDENEKRNDIIGVTGLRDSLVVIARKKDTAVAILSHPSLSLSSDEAKKRGLEVHYPGSKLAALYKDPYFLKKILPRDNISLSESRFTTLIGYNAEFIAEA